MPAPGKKGLKDADICAGSLASQLDLEKCQVMVASTGVIGVPLPLTKILKGVSTAVSALSTRGGEAAARAIMTTDTHEKAFAVEGRIKGKTGADRRHGQGRRHDTPGHGDHDRRDHHRRPRPAAATGPAAAPCRRHVPSIA